jgi:hypothetical protein
MVLHGFIEFAGTSANLMESYSPVGVLLNSMATGASPRYTFTAEPTRNAQFSPHERLYSTHYINWIDKAVEHYRIFNDVYRHLRAEAIVGFDVLCHGGVTAHQVSVTVFANGTRIYVNHQHQPYSHGDITIPAQWFVVQEAVR